MPLKIALVGAGHMGKIHIEKLASLRDCEIAGVADIDPEKTRQLSEQYGVPLFVDHKSLIGKIDGVIIATPTETHHQIAKDFLEAGVHVLMEKPITSTQEEAKELIELSKKKKLVFQVGFLERFNPAFTTALPLLKKPLLIESSRASSFTGRSTDIDVTLDLMIHDIDLTLSIVQDEVHDIRAQGLSFVLDKLDVASARLEFRKGCIVNLNSSRVSVTKERTLTIFEQDQAFFIDLMNRKVLMTVKNNTGNIFTEECPVDQMDAVEHEISSFIQSISSGTDPIVTGEDGLRALALADQIKQHIAERKLT
jgi:predicted dehydrogenase